MADENLIFDLECNHKAIRRDVSIYSRAVAEIDRLRALNADLLAACEAYEEWEGDMILSGEAWAGGIAEFPTLTPGLWDRLLEIQAMRNAAIAKARGQSAG